jgi:hypothetical protein
MERQILKFSMLIGVLSFVLAVVIGVWRIALTRGFLLPPIPEFLPPHGNIMVGAFLGTLIIFERMLALPVKWLLWVPFLWALSSLTVHLEPIMFKAINLISLIGWGIHRWIAYRTFKHLWNPLIEFIAYILLSLALMKTNGLAESPISAIAGLSFAICVIGVERIELMLGFKKFTAKLVYALLILYSIFLIFNLLVYEMAIEVIGVALIITTIGMFFNDASMMAKFGENKFKTPISALQKFSKGNADNCIYLASSWRYFSDYLEFNTTCKRCNFSFTWAWFHLHNDFVPCSNCSGLNSQKNAKETAVSFPFLHFSSNDNRKINR